MVEIDHLEARTFSDNETLDTKLWIKFLESQRMEEKVKLPKSLKKIIINEIEYYKDEDRLSNFVYDVTTK